jgi:hypothetical protein
MHGILLVVGRRCVRSCLSSIGRAACHPFQSNSAVMLTHHNSSISRAIMQRHNILRKPHIRQQWLHSDSADSNSASEAAKPVSATRAPSVVWVTAGFEVSNKVQLFCCAVPTNRPPLWR